MHAKLKNARISSRKMGLAAKMVRRQKATKAEVLLRFAQKKAANMLGKLLQSAIANAKQKGQDINDLFIKEIFVGPGITMKRFSPRAKGNAYT
ncbi:MAG: 50S ribosomal protein L22, partial [Bacteroidota bacterium]